ncbi:N-acetylmuramoyl-L-alanine amidase [Paenibacillus sp. NPDC058071]|uniref:N-acetylmuramoyl-L-alanine amidase n=1 Tax=Paenibacillus sp. NPDC058071 TaxID=3346326 RepID=UPI0036DD97D7
MATIIRDFIPLGRANRTNKPIDGPRFITVHDTANKGKGANAISHAAYLKSDRAAALPVSWHFTVDDKRVVQHLPLTEHGWHAGDGGKGQGNLSSIGIEICENADGDRAKAEQNAIVLIGDLLLQFKLPITSVVQHNRWSGKNCPHTFRSKPGSWETFIEYIKRYMEQNKEEDTPMTPAERKQLLDLQNRLAELEATAKMKIPPWAQSAMEAAIKAGVIDSPADEASRDFYRLLTIMHRKGLL